MFPQNLTDLALGSNVSAFVWTIESEPFSTFSYSIMRNNVFSLCENPLYEKMRRSIIYLRPPQLISQALVEANGYENDTLA